jgi:hypothetical protein
MVDKRWIIAATILMGIAIAPFGVSQDADCLNDLNPLARIRVETKNPTTSSENREPSSSGGSTSAPPSTSNPRSEPPPSSGSEPIITIPEEGVTGVFQLLMYLAIGAIVVFLLYLLFRYFANRSGSLPRPITEEEGDTLSTAPIPKLVSDADVLATSGDYRMALRYMLTAALRHLDRRGVLDYKITSTDWEHLRMLQSKGHQAMYDRLFPATQMVERKWYGVSEASAEDYDQVQRIIQPILAGEGRA